MLKGVMYDFDLSNSLDVDGVAVVTQSNTVFTLSPCHGQEPVTMKGTK